MTTQKLPLGQVAVALARIQLELGQANRKRLSVLQTVCEKNPEVKALQIGELLQALYPGHGKTQAVASLAKLRRACNEAALEVGIRLKWWVDQEKKQSENRLFWFEGEDAKTLAARKHTEQKADTGGEKLEVAQGISLDKRMAIRFFVSYARANQAKKTQFLQDLMPKLSNDPDYNFSLWQDGDIVLGENWDQAIHAAMVACDFGLLLTSSEFFASDYIVGEELPAFDEGSGKPAIPVGLEQYDFALTNMHGLEKRQIFRDNDRFYDRVSGAKRKDFVTALHKKIHQAISHHTGSPPPGAKSSPAIEPMALLPLRAKNIQQGKFAPDCQYPEPTYGTLAKVGEVIQPAQDKASIGVLADLHSWLAETDGSPFYVLLGDLGLGKTTTLRMLTQALLQDPNAPTPLYFDLRDLSNRSSGGNLHDILQDLLEHSWGVQPGELQPQDIIDLVQKQGALAIFDGLDEILVNMDTAQGQLFTRQLWQILPSEQRTGSTTRPRGRLLLSCRTHYFPTVHEQNSYFLGQDREHISAKDYRGVILLPFTEAQIKSYLRNNFPKQDVDRAWQLIQSIHNLEDLATRPYTMAVIAQHLGALEAQQAQGETIDAVQLYEVIIADWLNRDEGKHQLIRDHKRQLMAQLAYDLWQSESRAWRNERLESWLVATLQAHPAITNHYTLGQQEARSIAKLTERFKEDLRTATFIVRPDDNQFRFAHSSMLEYFLALRLYQLCQSQPAAAFAFAPSEETWAFLAQIANKHGSAPLLAALHQIRKNYQEKVSENAFRYCLFATAHSWPTIPLLQWDLHGAQLRDLRLLQAKGKPRLNLSASDFSGADLRAAQFENTRLDHCQFQGAQLLRAGFINCMAQSASFQGADLSAAIFRNRDGSIWRATNFQAAKLYRAQWLNPVMAWPDCVWPEKEALAEAFSFISLPFIAPEMALRWREGHINRVNGCVFSPDGRFIISAGRDHTLMLWDASSGECLMSLLGHTDAVRGCAFAPKGQRIVSASADHTLKIWDAHRGECLMTLQGHSGIVWACAFSPDGCHIISASGDNTLMVWDAHDGEYLLTLEGHSDWVRGCAFSADGYHIVSASRDNTLKVWDAHSGRCLITLQGHSGFVMDCAFSPDGSQIASASGDDTLKIWDVYSGECLVTLQGHFGAACACIFSPDGHHIASASWDHTLKIWDAHSGECQTTLLGYSGSVNACAYSPDGHHIVSASWDNTLKIWDTHSGECQTTLQGYTHTVQTCAFSPDGCHIASTSQNNSLMLWDAYNGAFLTSLAGHFDAITACTFAPEGQHIVSSSRDKTLKIWDIHSCTCLMTLQGHSDTVMGCAFSPQGDRLVSASVDETLKIWDAHSGECLRTLQGHSGPVWACAFSPDGHHIASAGVDKTLKIWDAHSGECQTTLSDHSSIVAACAFSPDGHYLVSASWDHTLKIWNPHSGECLLTLQGHSNTIFACTFSPDGHHIASASRDHTLKIWDAHKGTCLLTLSGHSGPVLACAYSPDGQRLVSASEDGSVRQWHATTGAALQPVFYPQGERWCALDEVQNQVLHCGSEAWRSLAWVGQDQHGQPRRYPAECKALLP